MSRIGSVSKSTLFALALLAPLLSFDSAAQTFSPEYYPRSLHRMGAFQCLRCPKGGFIAGIRSGDQSRVRREFSAIQEICTARYGYVDGEQYVYFAIDSALWPDEGAWGLKADSWNAECHLK